LCESMCFVDLVCMWDSDQLSMLESGQVSTSELGQVYVSELLVDPMGLIEEDEMMVLDGSKILAVVAMD